MAEQYTEWAVKDSGPQIRYTERLLQNLPAISTVLELGCGAGVPILETIINHPSVEKVYANDISQKQLELAKSRCPSATFFHGGMRAVPLGSGTLDGVAVFFSIFHLPREEQPAMLKQVHGWLKDGGWLAFNLGAMDNAEIRGRFFGAEMYWSSYDVETSKQMVKDAGFELQDAEVLNAGENMDPSNPDYDRKFLWIFARKAGGG